jgi:hypothetical protein
MKKAIVLAFSVIALSSAKAQIQFGVKAGVNLANLTLSNVTDNTASLKTNTDFNAGLLAYIPIAKSLVFQPEVVYSGQGSKLSYPSDQTANGTLAYSYINVPLVVKYAHSSGLFAETGPQVGFLISAKAKADGQSTDIKSSVQSTDFSWAFGVGYKIPEVNLGIDVRYNLGLTNLNKDDTNGKVKNSVFQIGLFYLFSLGGK